MSLIKIKTKKIRAMCRGCLSIQFFTDRGTCTNCGTVRTHHLAKEAFMKRLLGGKANAPD